MRTDEGTGIWIDHSRALVVHLNGDDVEVKQLESNLESKHRSTGGVRAPFRFWHRTSTAQARTKNKQDNDMRTFFKLVQREAGHSRNLIILGPGQIKMNLKSFLLANGEMESQLKSMETTHSRLTDPEIVALIKERLGKPALRFGKEVAL